MIQTATQLAYGAAILVLYFLLAVALSAQDASNLLSGVVINAYGAAVPTARISLRNGIPVRVEMAGQRQK